MRIFREKFIEYKSTTLLNFYKIYFTSLFFIFLIKTLKKIIFLIKDKISVDFSKF